MDDFHVYYCSRPNLGYVRVGREPRPVATRSYTLAADRPAGNLHAYIIALCLAREGLQASVIDQL